MLPRVLILTQFSLETSDALKSASNGGVLLIGEKEMRKVKSKVSKELPPPHLPQAVAALGHFPSLPVRGRIKPVGLGTIPP